MTPSIWPAVLSVGLTLAAFGVPTNPLFSIAGVLLTLAALVGWIGELRRGGDAEEHSPSHH